MALALDGQDALQGGGGDTQPLGHGDVILHGLGDGMPADHQDAGAAEQVAANVDAALVLLRHRVIEEKGQEKRRTDGSKARIIDRPAVLRGKLRVFAVAAVPCRLGCSVCSWPVFSFSSAICYLLFNFVNVAQTLC